MKLSKMKKILLTTTITTLSLSVMAYATPIAYKSLKMHYNVNLVVNGVQYAGQSEATKPFITEGGRTYISIASLVDSKIANATFDPTTATVTVTNPNNANQEQMAALSNKVLALENQNEILKAENENLKRSGGTKSGTNKSGSGKNLALKEITKSTDRTTFERDIAKTLRGSRANVYGFGSQRFDDSVEVKISTTSNKVTVTLYDSSSLGDKSTSSSRISDWNKAVNGKNSDNMKDDYQNFIESEVMRAVKDTLTDYIDYDIEVRINGYKNNSDTSKDEYELVYAKYTASKDSTKTSLYDVR